MPKCQRTQVHSDLLTHFQYTVDLKDTYSLFFALFSAPYAHIMLIISLIYRHKAFNLHGTFLKCLVNSSKQVLQPFGITSDS